VSDLVFLTKQEADPGFRLAGFVQKVADSKVLEEELVRLVTENRPRLVVVDQQLAEGIDPQKMREMQRRFAGVIATMPVREPLRETLSLMLLRQALGEEERGWIR